MVTLAEYEKSLEPSDSSIAAEIQSPRETLAQAYVRAIEMTDTGKALYKAYRGAPDTASRLPEKYKFIAEIQRSADSRFPELPTPKRRFAHAIDSDVHRRPYDKVCKVLYETSKSAPGCDIAPTAPEPPADIAKAVASRAGSANARTRAGAPETQPNRTRLRSCAFGKTRKTAL